MTEEKKQQLKKDQPKADPSVLRGKPKKILRKFQGVVKSDKMKKTIVVEIQRVKVHPKYGKRFAVSKGYKVHDEKNKFKEGDKVEFIECRPLSKNKRWRVLYNTNGHK